MVYQESSLSYHRPSIATTPRNLSIARAKRDPAPLNRTHPSPISPPGAYTPAPNQIYEPIYEPMLNFPKTALPALPALRMTCITPYFLCPFPPPTAENTIAVGDFLPSYFLLKVHEVHLSSAPLPHKYFAGQATTERSLTVMANTMQDWCPASTLILWPPPSLLPC